ncbi:hypothetical protein SHI21_08245 [Bacteriovorax sp. PP10]|uniref:Uncharacterized protein n=1 Tax=Bacteriovorax antarcticus TaxID=3088717 RepID=A0ABU5VT13_9BACT|nr:hypothetical protein [Bacteriovorax sp. PP10]MEA9356188.1 hypothetical protein [Bacteriovorax sp. PP10]
MNNLFKILILLSASSSYAATCPDSRGKYGDGIQYQDMFCRIMVSADKTDSKSYRNVTFTDEGLVQVFSNFPGTTNSNSTGARVYYLFPYKEQKSITNISAEGLSVKHPSGVSFNFDKDGKLSSPDLQMKVSKEINSQNKSGVEIESFPNGIVIDLGYRGGASPTNNKNAVVTITDKNKKKCTMVNSDINKINKDEVELIYKTNEELHKFLSKKCPKLDISDLLKPMKETLKVVITPKKVGLAPVNNKNTKENDSKREAKPAYDTMEELLKDIDKGAIQR